MTSGLHYGSRGNEFEPKWHQWLCPKKSEKLLTWMLNYKTNKQNFKNITSAFSYRWAFIGGAAAGEVEDDIDLQEEEEKQGSRSQDQKSRSQDKKQRARSQQISFKPHIIRLAKLLNTKVCDNQN